MTYGTRQASRMLEPYCSIASLWAAAWQALGARHFTRHGRSRALVAFIWRNGSLAIVGLVAAAWRLGSAKRGAYLRVRSSENCRDAHLQELEQVWCGAAERKRHSRGGKVYRVRQTPLVKNAVSRFVGGRNLRQRLLADAGVFDVGNAAAGGWRGGCFFSLPLGDAQNIFARGGITSSFAGPATGIERTKQAFLNMARRIIARPAAASRKHLACGLFLPAGLRHLLHAFSA